MALTRDTRAVRKSVFTAGSALNQILVRICKNHTDNNSVLGISSWALRDNEGIVIVDLRLPAQFVWEVLSMTCSVRIALVAKYQLDETTTKTLLYRRSTVAPQTVLVNAVLIDDTTDISNIAYEDRTRRMLTDNLPAT
ncbi:hypothetical protein AC578_6349 [Pseudocercospora eumusae]|uniref:Uncharacterized protein n=1 Tax=Pseudocercospora eumusae TaxID=321146 RepID=A0A139HGE7_9PEZI|nr:hypothetical protein AC578_6349 [Pseudocercospora eumusae]